MTDKGAAQSTEQNDGEGTGRRSGGCSCPFQRFSGKREEEWQILTFGFLPSFFAEGMWGSPSWSQFWHTNMGPILHYVMLVIGSIKLGTVQRNGWPHH